MNVDDTRWNHDVLSSLHFAFYCLLWPPYAAVRLETVFLPFFSLDVSAVFPEFPLFALRDLFYRRRELSLDEAGQPAERIEVGRHQLLIREFDLVLLLDEVHQFQDTGGVDDSAIDKRIIFSDLLCALA